VWSARTLDLDSVSARFPYPIAPWILQQLPADDVPSVPARVTPEPLDETMHLGYAIQWFLIALLLISGAALLFRAGARRASTNRT
jgi:cytochrome oxidase assembly protein ShyY1